MAAFIHSQNGKLNKKPYRRGLLNLEAPRLPLYKLLFVHTKDNHTHISAKLPSDGHPGTSCIRLQHRRYTWYGTIGGRKRTVALGLKRIAQ